MNSLVNVAKLHVCANAQREVVYQLIDSPSSFVDYIALTTTIPLQEFYDFTYLIFVIFFER